MVREAGFEQGLSVDEDTKSADQNPALLPMFIDAKRVEGCSEKSLTPI